MNCHSSLLNFIIWCSICSSCQCYRDFEAELVSYLKNNITNYSPLLRPCLDNKKVMQIEMGIVVGQLVSVDSAKQSVKISALILATWLEERLVWNATEYGDISIVNWESTEIWFPVILSYNGIGDNQVLTQQIPVYLRSLSPNLTSVTATWRGDFEFSCIMDVSRFPLDQHTCELQFIFSDQGHQNTLLQPAQASVPFDELGSYLVNSEWIMLNASSRVESGKYKLFKALPPIQIPTYVLSLEIKRVSNYYFANIITPLLLLTLLQVLLYFVPLESGEKLGFGITIMLSYTVFLLLLDGIVPKSQTMPAIASFITAAMILSTISLLLTSLIMRFHFTPEGTRMPACARVVFVRFLGRLFCVRGAKVGHVTSDVSESSVRKSDGGSAAAVGSDWVMAAHAIERLMVALGVIATAVIIAVFVVVPYV